MAACRDAMQSAAATAGRQARRRGSARALDEAAARGPAILPALRQAVLDRARAAARRCCADCSRPSRSPLHDLPPELRDSWIAADGRARVEVFPKGDARDTGCWSALSPRCARLRPTRPARR